MKQTKLRLSHIHWRVNNIKKAVNDIEKLGFKVEWGRNPKYSPNAFIWFNDDAFIEIFTTGRPLVLSSPVMGLIYGKGMEERWKLWNKRKEGLIDFAVEAYKHQEGRISNLGRIRNELIKNGINVSKIMNGTRKNTRGEKVGFGFCGPLPVELPFLVSAFTIPQIPEKIEHPNGIKKIKYIKIECQKELNEKMEMMLCNDKRVVIVPGNETRIQSIAFDGNTSQLDKRFLHGMIVDD